ncbi:MAG: hypothetical protein AAF226_13900 [Verrucomicrobiota bacterium]
MKGLVNLQAAEAIAALMQKQGIDCIVIGAIALAGHNYVRFTRDIDLGVVAEPKVFNQVANEIKSLGHRVELREGSFDDPLAGVIDISGNFGLVQIINFHERFPAVIWDAVNSSQEPIRENSPLKLIPLPHLVALKLYAGGLKSKADILELLRSNPEADIDEIIATCNKYRLRGLEEILKELNGENPAF